MTGPACGTRAGYQAHVNRGEITCGPCKEANRVYTANFRAANPRSIEQLKRTQAFRLKALRRLAELYPDEYQRVYRDVLNEAIQQRQVATP